MSLLQQVQSPQDLRHLTSLQLGELASEIRQYLIASVAATGGHLGPNLGVVELTIAIHRVFDSPHDVIVFDTGHQAYVHKLLTGRHDFTKLRARGGLSGYPCRAESVHDVVESSHASASLSWSDGIANALKTARPKSHVVAVIGDGALTGGMAWEALNNIAEQRDIRLVIIVNDNGRSYAPTIGGLAHHLDALRTAPAYEKALNWGKEHLRGAGLPGELAYDALHGIKKGVKDIVAPQMMFEDLGIKYTGPVDGHDIVACEFALTRAKEYGAPVIVHTLTEKGRGYRPAEKDIADRFHAVGKIHPETGLPVEPSRFGWTAVFAEEMVEIGREMPEVVGITAAMLAPVGLAPFAQAYPERVYDVGIAEQHAMTLAAGMSYAGLHPVIALYSTFMNRAFDQLLMDVALHGEGVTVVLDRAGITGDDGPSHNGMWDLSLAAIVPGFQVAAPRDETRLRAALRRAVRTNSPTLIRYPKGSLGPDIPALTTLPLPAEAAAGESVAAEVIRTGQPGALTVIATGPLVATAQRAATRIGDERIRIIDPLWCLPVSPQIVTEIAQAQRVITLEDGMVESGVGAAIRAAADRADLDTPIRCLGVPKEFIQHATRAQVLADIGLDEAGVEAALRTALAKLG